MGDDCQTCLSDDVQSLVQRAFENPNTIGPGALVWLTDPGIVNSGGTSPQWDNAGSFAGSFEQATVANQPAVVTIGSRRVLRFDGIDDQMDANGGIQLVKPYVTAALILVPAAPYFGTPIMYASGRYRLLPPPPFTFDRVAYSDPPSLVGFGQKTSLPGVWNRVIATIDHSENSYYVDGELQFSISGNATIPGIANPRLGTGLEGLSTDFAAFDLAEHSVWNNFAPTANDIRLIDEWMAFVQSEL